MFTLGIETSCDETSCAVLDGTREVRSNIVSSSLFRHKPFGGIVPEIASRHCLEQIDVVFMEALKQARIKAKDIGLIAVTQGPGLIGSLFVGIAFAKSLSYRLGIPMVGVNHLEAHLSANFIGAREPSRYIGLLVSGGHTHLTLHENGRARVLGATVDDAVGEAYDKVAKMLGLGYPGGPVIDCLAADGDARAFRFTKPKQKNRFDFSFSGIKTAVMYLTKEHRRTARFQKNVADSFQSTVVSWLVSKAIDAAEHKKISNIVIGGGVSANSHLRKSLKEESRAEKYSRAYPPLALTNDNAAMIARRGVQIYKERCPRILADGG